MVEPLFDDPLWLVGNTEEPRLQRAQTKTALRSRPNSASACYCSKKATACATIRCNRADDPTARGTAPSRRQALTLIQMVESGLGLALIPEMAVKSGLADSPHLLAQPLVQPGPSRTIALVARRSTSRLAELKALGEVIRAAK